ncbi:MAG: pilus assembly protein CpaD [Hyphomicrobium sp.]|nr:MAG: pilus assembly protein CpaD [Hyphomicrobium sp.]PPC99233.1 MAG: pilus assembly protein CpaD [Hyphomicrobium sp.]
MTRSMHTAREPQRKGQTLKKLAVIAMLPMLVTGCKHWENGSQVAGWSLVDPEQRHPIIVSQEPAHLNLSVHRGSQGLSPPQRASVLNFAGRYRASDNGNSRLIISAPSGSANEIAAVDAVDDARRILLDAGFSEAAISVEAYHDDRSQNPPVRISYMRFVAKGPECGLDWSENLGTSRTNIAHPNFGCAGQHNLAAMVANPADLLGPRSEGPRSSERRDAVMDKWTKGETTASDKTEDERVRTDDN